MVDLFPSIQPQTTETERKLKLCTEVKWDFLNDKPIFKNGKPVKVTENEAVKVWIFNALKTVRKRHVIYTRDYGNDVEELIGQPYSESLKLMEARRYIEECLLINPYIKTVNNIEVDFKGDKLTISFSAKTVYGDIEMGGDEFV